MAKRLPIPSLQCLPHLPGIIITFRSSLFLSAFLSFPLQQKWHNEPGRGELAWVPAELGEPEFKAEATAWVLERNIGF